MKRTFKKLPNSFSLEAIVEQTALLIRDEVKKPHLKDRSISASLQSALISTANTVEQVSRLLRTEIHRVTSKRKKKKK